MSEQTLATRLLPDEGYFTGREDELARVKALLAKNKLVVLEGLAGIGKTALALQYTYQTATDYEVVVWHEVGPGESAESVLVSIAAQLSDQGHEILLDAVTDPKKNWQGRTRTLIEVLRDLHVLLVLDSFNNCLDDTHRVSAGFAPLVDQLLGRTYASRVLLTTKIKPQISPAHLGKYATYELDGLQRPEAVPLFLTLCEGVGHDASEEEASQVCRAAGGHPFAIRIIVGLLHQGYLLSSLLDQMRERVVSDYGQFLLDIFYTRLTKGARRLLEACSAYRRPVSLPAIERLPADPKLMDQLLPYFLLELEPRSRRYFMHTIVREYAYDKLAREEERRRRVHKAAGDYYSSAMGDPLRQRDFGTVQRVLEAQYHYRDAEDQAGMVATAAYLADELKPLVRQLYREGKNELASNLYRAILAMDEQDAEMHYYYGRLLEKQRGAPEEIERHYREAVRLKPRIPERQMRYLVWLVKSKKYAEAHRAFKMAVKECGYYDQLYVPYAKALGAAGRQREAAVVLKEGLERVPPGSLAPLYQEYSGVLRAQGKLEEAAAALKEGLERVPRESLAPLYIEYSQVLRAQGKLEEAAAALKEGLERVPQESAAPLYIEYSQMLRAQGKLDEAAATLKEGLERVPPETASLLYIAYSQVLRAQSKPDDAAAVIKQGLEHVPHPSKAFLICAQAGLLFDQGDPLQAAKSLDDASQLTAYSSVSALHAYRACLHWAQDEIESAREKFEQGIRLNLKRSDPIYRYYGAFLFQTGSAQKARQILARAYNLPTESPQLDKLLSELSDVQPEELWRQPIVEPIGVITGVETLPVAAPSEVAGPAPAMVVSPEPAAAPLPGPIVNILHISDIHRGPNAPTSNLVLRGKLLDDIRRTYDEDNAKLGPEEPRLGPPDIIVVSGDLTQRADPAEYDLAHKFLEGSLELVGGDRERVVLAPGNHDVNWALSKKSYTTATEQEFTDQTVYDEPYRQMVKKERDAQVYWRKDEETYTERFRPFKMFFDNFYRGTAAAYTYPLDHDWMYTMYDYSRKYGLKIVGFNTCDEIDHLDRCAFINTDAIYRAEGDPAFHAGEAGLLRIAVFHHNIRSVQHGEDFLDHKYLQILKRHEFELCLHGHVHTAGVDIFDPAHAETLPLLGAGSLAAPYQDRPPAAPKGYNLIVINRENGGIFAHTRCHDEDHLVWKADYQWDGKPYVTVHSPASGNTTD